MQREPKFSPNDPPHSGASTVFVLPETAPQPQEPPSWLAERLGLLKYGQSLLSSAAHHELRAMAWVLLVVCLFEVAVWTFYFNAAFNRDVHYFGWGTLTALATATVFGFVVFFFERQMLTFDAGSGPALKRWLRLGSAGAARLTYIGITAWITATAFEAKFFRPAILQRAHEEAVLESKTRHYLELRKALRIASTEGSVTSAERRNRAEAEAAVQAAEVALRKAEGERDRLKGQIEAGQARLGVLRSDSLSIADPSEAKEELSSLSSGIARVRPLLETANDAVSRASSDLEEAKKALKIVVGDLTDSRRKDAICAELLATRLEQWVDALQVLRPTETRVLAADVSTAECNIPEWTFAPSPPEFLDQLRILRDLRLGEEPRWPPALQTLAAEGADAVKQVQKTYGFPGAPCDPEREPSSSACREAEARREAFGRGHLQSLILAAVIPSLVVFIKLFMLPDELRQYYSRVHQARAGEADARLSTSIDD